MKIGIASNDRESIAQHFGRTRGFVIADVVDGKVKSKEYRENNFTSHNQPGGSEQHGEHGHSHSSILSALKDCDVVLARGMGRRIYDDLRGAKIESVIPTLPGVDEALSAYVDGTLVDNPEKGCVH